MTEAQKDIDNYELVSIYHLNKDDQEQLLMAQKECVFNWCTKDSWPMGGDYVLHLARRPHLAYRGCSPASHQCCAAQLKSFDRHYQYRNGHGAGQDHHVER